MPDSPQPITTTGDSRASFFGDALAPRHRSRVGAVELELFRHQRYGPVDHRTGREEFHHLAHEVVGERIRLAAAVAVVGDRRDRAVPHRGLFLGRHARLELHRGEHPRPFVTANPRRITGHVHQRTAQRGNAHVVEVRADPLGVVGERRTGVGIPRRAHAANLRGRRRAVPEHATAVPRHRAAADALDGARAARRQSLRGTGDALSGLRTRAEHVPRGSAEPFREVRDAGCRCGCVVVVRRHHRRAADCMGRAQCGGAPVHAVPDGHARGHRARRSPRWLRCKDH